MSCGKIMSPTLRAGKAGSRLSPVSSTIPENNDFLLQAEDNDSMGKHKEFVPQISFLAMEKLLQVIESAVCDFQNPKISERRLKELVAQAKLEQQQIQQQMIDMQRKTNALEVKYYAISDTWTKMEAHAEKLRVSSYAKDPEVQQLVAIIQRVNAETEEPELGDNEQQDQQDAKWKSKERLERDESDEYEDDDSSLTSNQTEDDHDTELDEEDEDILDPAVTITYPDGRIEKASSKLPIVNEKEQDLNDKERNRAASTGSGKAAALLPLTVAEPKIKGIQEPKPPRGGLGSGMQVNRATKSSRLKFQFLDTELRSVLDDETLRKELSNGASSPALRTLRRGTSPAAMTTILPLRRASFTMKRSPLKSVAEQLPPSSTSEMPIASVKSSTKSFNSPAKSRLADRRKSMSACYSTRRSGLSTGVCKSPGKWTKYGANSVDLALSSAATASSLPPPCSKMVIRVRERKSDGVPELVISKKPAQQFIVWQWNDRRIRIPSMIQLGAHQHGIMLRQLRYVKSIMHDFPWAKAHLRDLLSSYTKKEMTKEQLYPQLTTLSHQVQQEISGKVKKQRQLMTAKQHLSLQLSISTGVLNDLDVTKFGRRGKPHDTKLCYDPSDPTRLHWYRKNGDKSEEFLPVDEIQIVQDVPLEASGVFKKAAKKYALDPTSCLTLVSMARTLHLQLKSPLHREWLVNALKDVIAFAKQYKAASGHGRRQQHHLLRLM